MEALYATVSMHEHNVWISRIQIPSAGPCRYICQEIGEYLDTASSRICHCCDASCSKIDAVRFEIVLCAQFDGGNDREFHAEENNPDHCNASLCCSWKVALHAEHWHKFEKDYSRDLVSRSEIPLNVSNLTPDKILTKLAVTKTGNFMPRVEVNKHAFSRRRCFKNYERDLNARDTMRWFITRRKGEERYEVK